MDGGIPWEINGAAFRVDPRVRQLLAHSYDSSVAEFLRSHVREGSICFDVGANVGVYVLQLARWTGPTGRVIAFEPNPSALTVLRRHIAMNNFSQTVTVVPKAVSSTEGSSAFFSVGADAMSRLGAPNPLLRERATRSAVDVTTLDAFVESTGMEPDWVVMDIEGLELQALQGFRRTLTRLAGRVGLVVELHPPIWVEAGTSVQQAKNLLKDLGLHPVPMTGQRDPWQDHGLVRLIPADSTVEQS
jgi:FkbM family methyltransferase